MYAIRSYYVILSRFEGHPPVPGTLRSVPVVPVDGVDGLAAWCASLRPHLSCLGQAGWGDRLPRVVQAALDGGGSRVCRLGKMQLPPLGWRHDGLGPIRPLLRELDVEEEDAP